MLVLLGDRGLGSRWASRTFAAPSSSKYVSEGRFRHGYDFVGCSKGTEANQILWDVKLTSTLLESPHRALPMTLNVLSAWKFTPLHWVFLGRGGVQETQNNPFFREDTGGHNQ